MHGPTNLQTDEFADVHSYPTDWQPEEFTDVHSSPSAFNLVPSPDEIAVVLSFAHGEYNGNEHAAAQSTTGEEMGYTGDLEDMDMGLQLQQRDTAGSNSQEQVIQNKKHGRLGTRGKASGQTRRGICKWAHAMFQK